MSVCRKNPLTSPDPGRAAQAPAGLIRREFLKLGAILAGVLALHQNAAEALAATLESPLRLLVLCVGTEFANA